MAKPIPGYSACSATQEDNASMGSRNAKQTTVRPRNWFCPWKTSASRTIPLGAMIPLGALVLLAATIAGGEAPARCQPVSSRFWQSEPSRSRADQMTDVLSSTIFELGDFYWHRGDFRQLVRIDDFLQQIDPSFTEAYSNGAWLEWSDGNAAAARRRLEQGIANNPNDPEMLLLAAEGFWLWLKQPALALPYYIRATDSFLNAPWRTFDGLAHTAEQAGDLDRAVIAWKMALLKTGDDPLTFEPSQRNLQRVLDRMAAEKAAAASAPPARNPQPADSGAASAPAPVPVVQ